MPCSSLSMNTGGTGTPEARAISSTTFSRRRSTGSVVFGIDAPAAEPLGHHGAAAGQLGRLVQAAADDQSQSRHALARIGNSNVEPCRAYQQLRSAIAVATNVVPTMPITAQHEHHHQPLRIAAGDGLTFEEVGGHERVEGQSVKGREPESHHSGAVRLLMLSGPVTSRLSVLDHFAM